MKQETDLQFDLRVMKQVIDEFYEALNRSFIKMIDEKDAISLAEQMADIEEVDANAEYLIKFLTRYRELLKSF